MFDCVLHTSTNPIIGVNFINSSSHFATYVLDFLTVHGMKRSSWADRMNQLFLLQYTLPVGSMINSSLSWCHKDILKFHNFAYLIDMSLIYLKLVLSVWNEVWMPRSSSWYCLTMFPPFPLNHDACSIKKWITCIWIYFWVIMFLLSVTLSFHKCHSCLIKMALYANLGISCNKYFFYFLLL